MSGDREIRALSPPRSAAAPTPGLNRMGWPSDWPWKFFRSTAWRIEATVLPAWISTSILAGNGRPNSRLLRRIETSVLSGAMCGAADAYSRYQPSIWENTWVLGTRENSTSASPETPASFQCQGLIDGGTSAASH